VRGIFGLGSEKAPARLASLLDRDLTLLEKLGAEALEQARHTENTEALDVARLNDLDPALATRAVRLWLNPMQPEGLERVHVDGILTWLREGQSGSSLDLPGGVTLSRDLDRVMAASDRSDAPPLRAAADYRILVAKGGDFRETGDIGDESTWQLTCPAGALSGNLQVRNWREGDRFQPFGLDGTKKLSDLLREKRLPVGDRPGVLVVSDDAGILWVVGLARAERTRLLPTTTHTVTISVARRTDHLS
jgi:tRNA(Ile)-lysidine synthetase-like protein